MLALILMAPKIFLSIRTKKAHDFPLPRNVIRKPVISHFTRDSIVFVDKTEIDVDYVILATGYQVRKPYLDAGHTLVTDPTANSNNTKTQVLFSNTRYIFPLYRHIFSLSPIYPTTALAFVGLPAFIPHCASDIIQSIFIAYMIRDPSLLPSRQQMLYELKLQEDKIRSYGVDPYVVGHKMLGLVESNDYQDELFDYLKEKVRNITDLVHMPLSHFIQGRDPERWKRVRRGMAPNELYIYLFEARVEAN